MTGFLTSWQDIAVVIILVTAINAGFFWAIKWLVINSLKDCRESNETLKDGLSSLKENLPRDYVRREDWIMGFAKIEQKIDGIWNYIHQNSKNSS